MYVKIDQPFVEGFFSKPSIYLSLETTYLRRLSREPPEDMSWKWDHIKTCLWIENILDLSIAVKIYFWK